MRTHTLRTLLVVSLAALAACGDAESEDTIPATLPDAGAATFIEVVDNRYWPLTPGSQWVYEGEDEGEFEHIEVTVPSQRRTVMGVSTVVVRDVVTLEDGVIEDTFDWYAQDADGNVWYMGEDSKEIEDGEVVSTEGSWEAGVDGAKPGVIMWADPMAHAGQAYYQEFYEGEAEDKAEVLRIEPSLTVAAGTFEDVLVTREWDPLEPGIFELKYYAPGVGLILEEIEKGGEARIELISYSLGA
jgi:hypothetical protein